jgi:predicted transcriptional regulator
LEFEPPYSLFSSFSFISPVADFISKTAASLILSGVFSMRALDERILAALKGGKPRDFAALLGEVGFTHNTLQQHLQRLTSRGLVVKEKKVSNKLGRPKFSYRVPSAAAKQVIAALENPYEAFVTLRFTRLRHVCRFEKGGHCKETRKNCEPQICPQTRK